MIDYMDVWTEGRPSVQIVKQVMVDGKTQNIPLTLSCGSKAELDEQTENLIQRIKDVHKRASGVFG